MFVEHLLWAGDAVSYSGVILYNWIRHSPFLNKYDDITIGGMWGSGQVYLGIKWGMKAK